MSHFLKWALLGCLYMGLPQWASAEALTTETTTTTTTVSAEDEAAAKAKAKAEKKAAADRKAVARMANCSKCHDGDEGMHGKHSDVTNPNTGDKVTCTNCHGNVSAKHRKQRGGMVDVMRFGDEAFPLDQQNGVCMSCHEPDALRKSLWAHDVHATKLTCTSCHSLHPAKEPMAGITEQSRIKLCVDCHSKQHDAKQKAAKENEATQSPAVKEGS